MAQLGTCRDTLGVSCAGLLDGKLQIGAGTRYLNRFTDRPAAVDVDEQVDARPDHRNDSPDRCEVFVDVASARFQLQFVMAFILQTLRERNRVVG